MSAPESSNAAAYTALTVEKEIIRLRGIREQADMLGLRVFSDGTRLDVKEVTPENLRRANEQVEAAKKDLEAFGQKTMTSMMEEFEYSAIFQVVREKKEFVDQLLGRTVTIDGKKHVLDKKLIDFLTIQMALGTPPVTAQALGQFRSVLLGNSDPGEIKEFARMIGADYQDMARLTDRIADTIAKDTHYLTGPEEEAHLEDSIDPRFENFRHLQRTMVSGGPEQAENLVRMYLFKKQKKDSIKTVKKSKGEVNRDLINEIKENSSAIYLLHVDEAAQYFVQDEEWRSELGRIIFIDDSEEAQKTGHTYAYNFFDEFNESLSTVRTNIVGRPSSTQMALREILQEFSAETISDTYEKVEKMLKKIDAELGGVSYDGRGANADDEKIQTLTADYFSLKNFKDTLDVIREIKGYEGQEDFESFQRALVSKTKHHWAKYLYRGLLEAGHKPVIGNGGNREGLHTVGLFLRDELLESLDNGDLEDDTAGFFNLGARRRAGHSTINEASRQAGMNHRSQADIRRRSQQAGPLFRVIKKAINVVGDAKLTPKMAAKKNKIEVSIDEVLRGEVEHGPMVSLLQHIGEYIESKVIAVEERFSPTDEDRPETRVGSGMRQAKNIARAQALKLMKKSYSSLCLMIGDISPDDGFARAIEEEIRDKGNINGRLVTEEVMWSYGNVYEEDQFPVGKRIVIERGEDGRLNTVALRQKMEMYKGRLVHRPKLFAALCKSMVIIINSPHNPTSRVLDDKEIIAVLDVASDFGLTVVDDSAYYKIVRSVEGSDGKMTRPHHPPVAEIAEDNNHIFTGGVPRVITVACPTKNLSAAGGRLHLVMSKDPKVTSYVEEKYSHESPNNFAMHCVNKKVEHGQKAKDVYKDLKKFLKQPVKSIDSYLKYFRSNLSPKSLRQSGISHEGYELITGAYYHLCLITGRNGSEEHARIVVERLCEKLKYLRPEKAAARDVDRRFEAAERAIGSVKNAHGEPINYRKPEGAFYLNVELDKFEGSNVDMQEFMQILNRRTGVGLVKIDGNYVRIAIGGDLEGDQKSYEMLEAKVRIGLKVLYEYWGDANKYESLKSFDADLAIALKEEPKEGETGALAALLIERKEILDQYSSSTSRISINKNEDGVVYQIQDTSKGINIVMEVGADVTDDPRKMLDTESFGTMYEFLLRNFYRDIPELRLQSEGEILADYSVDMFKRAFDGDTTLDEHQREMLKEIAIMLQIRWYSSSIRTNILQVCEGKEENILRSSELVGRNIQTIFKKVAGDVPSDVEADMNHGFASGYQTFRHVEGSDNNIEAHDDAPDHMKLAIENNDFVGKMVNTKMQTEADTAATKRVQGRAWGFEKRSEEEGKDIKEKLKSDAFVDSMKSGEFLCVAVRAGLSKQLFVIHKSNMHLLRDLSRLFPQEVEVTDPKNLNKADFDAVTYFGIPKKIMGEHQMTGYFIDETTGGKKIPTAWVSRADATDYVGFMKKTILTLHNEIMLEKGAVPIHGAMYKLRYNDGRTFGIIGSSDSGGGKSEMIAKIREMLHTLGPEALHGLEGVEVMAGDMLSLHVGEDGKIYAFGTETGDFVRMDDLIGTPYEELDGHIIAQGSITNRGVVNERITVPYICDTEAVLSPNEVNAIMYNNNYAIPPGGKSVEMTSIEDAFDNIIEGYRINKGTSGDLPDFDGCLKKCREQRKVQLVEGKDMKTISFSAVLKWDRPIIDGKEELCVSYRDGESNPERALMKIKEMFLGEKVYFTADQVKGEKMPNFPEGSRWTSMEVADIEYDRVDNVFFLKGHDGERVLLTVDVFSPLAEQDESESTLAEDAWLEKSLLAEGGPLYQRIVKMFFSSCFAHTSEGNREVAEANLEVIKEAAAKLVESGNLRGGIIYTQLARMQMNHEGPQLAGRDMMETFASTDFKTEEFQQKEEDVQRGLANKLRATCPGSSSVPSELLTHNIRRKDKHSQKNVRVRTKGVSTPFYPENAPEEKESNGSFEFDLVPPNIRSVLSRSLQKEPRRPREIHITNDIQSRYPHFKDMVKDSIDQEELTFRILLSLGWAEMSTTESQIESTGNAMRLQIAMKIAKDIMPQARSRAAA